MNRYADYSLLQKPTDQRFRKAPGANIEMILVGETGRLPHVRELAGQLAPANTSYLEATAERECVYEQVAQRLETGISALDRIRMHGATGRPRLFIDAGQLATLQDSARLVADASGRTAPVIKRAAAERDACYRDELHPAAWRSAQAAEQADLYLKKTLSELLRCFVTPWHPGHLAYVRRVATYAKLAHASRHSERAHLQTLVHTRIRDEALRLYAENARILDPYSGSQALDAEVARRLEHLTTEIRTPGEFRITGSYFEDLQCVIDGRHPDRANRDREIVNIEQHIRSWLRVIRN